MASYLTLALELRQQILFAAFALADEEDLFSLDFMRNFPDPINERHVWLPIRHHAQVRLSDNPEDGEEYSSVQPLWYAPAADKLVKTLLCVHPTMREDMTYVVETWYDFYQSRSCLSASLTIYRTANHATRSRLLFEEGIDHGIKRYFSPDIQGPYVRHGCQRPFLPRCWSPWILGFAFDSKEEEYPVLWYGEPSKLARAEFAMILALYDEKDGWENWRTYVNRWRAVDSEQ
jgi:hypothetical protein